MRWSLLLGPLGADRIMFRNQKNGDLRPCVSEHTTRLSMPELIRKLADVYRHRAVSNGLCANQKRLSG